MFILNVAWKRKIIYFCAVFGAVFIVYQRYTITYEENYTVDDVALVTAFDDSPYLFTAIRGCTGLKDHLEISKYIEQKRVKVIAYILDPEKKLIFEKYSLVCPFVEVRYFNYSKYPASFRENKREYRWKAMIIEDVLKEKNVIFWFDSSVIFRKEFTETLENMIKTMKKNFKCGIRTLNATGHTILAATNPGMYKFFNVTEKMKHMPMAAATTFVVLNNTIGRQIIDKVANCSMTKQCMGPDGASLWCKEPELHEDKYAWCHRYDQSALALALAGCTDNVNDFEMVSDLIYIQRGMN